MLFKFFSVSVLSLSLSLSLYRIRDFNMGIYLLHYYHQPISIRKQIATERTKPNQTRKKKKIHSFHDNLIGSPFVTNAKLRLIVCYQFLSQNSTAVIIAIIIIVVSILLTFFLDLDDFCLSIFSAEYTPRTHTRTHMYFEPSSNSGPSVIVVILLFSGTINAISKLISIR